MKLKKILGIIVVMFLLTAITPVSTMAATPASTETRDPEKDAQLLAKITTRVNEIQEMDKTNLSNSEKRSLRKELKQLHKDASGLDSKVYLSVGALIIIILILILVLR